MGRLDLILFIFIRSKSCYSLFWFNRCHETAEANGFGWQFGYIGGEAVDSPGLSTNCQLDRVPDAVEFILDSGRNSRVHTEPQLHRQRLWAVFYRHKLQDGPWTSLKHRAFDLWSESAPGWTPFVVWHQSEDSSRIYLLKGVWFNFRRILVDRFLESLSTS